ncbi:hypothetical protein [Acidaminobacterium chupaoyuni]
MAELCDAVKDQQPSENKREGKGNIIVYKKAEKADVFLVSFFYGECLNAPLGRLHF